MTEDIWHSQSKQDAMWKDGTYNYTFESLTAVKFNIAHFFINREVKGPYRILDIGAGIGGIYPLVADKTALYLYNDLSDTAIQTFKKIYRSIIKEKRVEYQKCLATDLKLEGRNFNVILGLGVAKGLFDGQLFMDLFQTHLAPNGVLILDMNTTEEGDFLPFLPQPTAKITLDMNDYKNNFPAYKRSVVMFKKVAP